VTGRPTATVERLLGPIDGVRIAGLYRFEDRPPVRQEVLDDVARICRSFPGTQVEPKGASVAVHFRNAADPTERAMPSARGSTPSRRGTACGSSPARASGSWRPPRPAGRGRPVAGSLTGVTPTAALYAGDDIADLEAFAALDRAGEDGSVLVRKVAVLGDETPVALREAADVVVEGPTGLLEMLGGL
jgi:trehalose 6-phosphate phosphatase